MNPGDFQDRRSNLLRDAVRYNSYVIVLFLVLGAAVGAGFAFLKAPTFSSSTTVIINQIPGNPYAVGANTDVLEMLQTEAVAVTSEDILTKVVDDLDLQSDAERLRRQTVVSVPTNTQALEITYASDDRQLSADVVDAVAAEYLRRRSALADAALARQIDSFTQQIDDTQKLLDATGDADPTSRAAAYQAEILELQAELAQVRAQPNDPGRVLTPGFVPAASDLERFALFGGAGAAAGALVGVAVALWRERRRDLIRSAGDLDDYAFEAPVTAIHGMALDERALRHLRMRLAPQIRDHGVVAVVGLARGRALATSVLLARSLSAGGTSVVLIDGTGTEGGHRDPLHLEGKPGLSQALLGDSPGPPEVFRVGNTFSYLPAGADAEAASAHLVDDRARTVVHGVSEQYDLTLVACMPLDHAEGEALARLTEGLILLVQLNRTAHYELGRALNTINHQGRRLLGVFVLPARR